MSTTTVAQEVRREATELKKFGVRVPRTAFATTDERASEFCSGGMKISAIAGLCIELP